MKHITSIVFLSALAMVGCCGGATPTAKTPEEPTPTESSPPPEPVAASDANDDFDSEEAEDPEAEESVVAAPDEPPPPDPEFPENASVQEAMDAVPQGAQRINVERELLGKPLTDPELYEPCNIGNQSFKLRIAIWNGRAVGVDVDTKNTKLEACLKEQIRAIEWPEPVPSLNTVEYAM